VKVLKADESTLMLEPHKIKWKKSKAYNTLKVGLKRCKKLNVCAAKSSTLLGFTVTDSSAQK
jgi:hypothetical protein